MNMRITLSSLYLVSPCRFGRHYCRSEARSLLLRGRLLRLALGLSIRPLRRGPLGGEPRTRVSRAGDEDGMRYRSTRCAV